MFEMAHSGEKHCDPFLVGHFYRVFVANASAGTHNGSHSIFGGEFHSVAKRQEPVGCEHKPFCYAGGLCLFKCDFGRAYTIHLSGAYTGCRSVFHHHDGVALHMLHNLPSEVEFR